MDLRQIKQPANIGSKYQPIVKIHAHPSGVLFSVTVQVSATHHSEKMDFETKKQPCGKEALKSAELPSEPAGNCSRRLLTRHDKIALPVCEEP